MKCSMSSETWASDRGTFVFRCHHPVKGDRWTFIVERATLEAFAAGEPFEPAATFDRLRPQIYAAAYIRMKYADPTAQQAITEEDIRSVG